MIARTLSVLGLLSALLWPVAALAETPTPETLATARELIETTRAAENMKLILPTLMQHLKPAIVQGRPQVEKDFDAMMPGLLESFGARLGEMTDRIAVIYASNFTVAEMKEVIAFYRGPTGQKFLAKAPVIMQQSMAVGQQLGAQIGRELQTKIIEELRKKGHDI